MGYTLPKLNIWDQFINKNKLCLQYSPQLTIIPELPTQSRMTPLLARPF